MNKTQEKERSSTAVIVICATLTIFFIGVVIWGFIALPELFESKESQRIEKQVEQEQSIVQVDTKSGNAPRERLVSLKDDRTVLCVDWNGSLSCDWESAK